MCLMFIVLHLKQVANPFVEFLLFMPTKCLSVNVDLYENVMVK